MADMKREKKKGRLASLLRGNNDGNSLVLVVVVMLVVMLLGVAILYSSYTAVLLRSSQRKSEKTFTSAETGMDLIREGLSEVNSDAVAAGYKDLLKSFSKDETANKQTFADGYMREIVNAAGDGEYLFPEAKTGIGKSVTLTRYSVKALDNYLKGKTKGTYTLRAVVNGSENEDTGLVTVTKNNNVILRGVRLRYSNGGYEEQITTDFRLAIPSASIASKYIGFNDALQNYNFIADQGLMINRYGETGKNPVNSNFKGSGYAGNVVMGSGTLTVQDNQSLIIGQTRELDVSDDGETITYKKRGDKVKRTSGDIVFSTAGDPAGHVEIGKGATLWANNISMSNGSELSSGENSHIYVRNDLNFATGGTATLKGTYYGFGYGKDIDGNPTNSASDSSSIIFNRSGKLDISGLNSLTLAGKSFITEASMSSVPTTGAGKNSGMGSSITTRPEQTAYLLPTTLFNTISKSDTDAEDFSNPRILDSSSDEANGKEADKAIDSIDEGKLRMHVDGLSKTLYDYGIRSKNDISILTYNVPGNNAQCVRYYFLKFPTQKDANDYFKDYFRNNKETINSYISSYAELTGFDGKATVRTAGTTIQGKNGNYNVTGGESSSDAEADTYNNNYRRLSETLTTSSDGPSTPFYTFIDVQKLHELCHKQGEFASDGTCHTATQENPVKDETGSNDVKVNIFWGNLQIGSNGNVVDNEPRKSYYKARGYSTGNYVYVVDGDVKLTGNFHGIIICSGVLELSYATEFEIENKGIQALKQTDIWKGTHGTSGSSETSKWEDVTYENWKKD